MLNEIDSGTIRILFSLQIAKEEGTNNIQPNQDNQEMVYQKEEAPSFNEDRTASQEKTIVQPTETITRDEPKLGRNDLVQITNGEETKEIKYKKAIPLIESGDWRMI